MSAGEENQINFPLIRYGSRCHGERVFFPTFPDPFVDWSRPADELIKRRLRRFLTLPL